MGISYITRVEGDTLFVKASGFDESIDDVRNYSTAILREGLLSSVHRVLCDETGLEYRIGTLDTYEIGKFLSENVSSLLRIAIVCNPAFVADAIFFENVTVNRGLTLRMFTDMDKAREWLGRDDTVS
jgi:hypothetical protein